jgi:hypothetical protein
MLMALEPAQQSREWTSRIRLWHCIDYQILDFKMLNPLVSIPTKLWPKIVMKSYSRLGLKHEGVEQSLPRSCSRNGSG